MIIVWDEPKRIANLAKHGIDFADIDEEFFVEAVIRPARPPRFRASGAFQGRLISVIIQPLGKEGLAIVSARPASDSERKRRDDGT